MLVSTIVTYQLPIKAMIIGYMASLGVLQIQFAATEFARLECLLPKAGGW